MIMNRMGMFPSLSGSGLGSRPSRSPPPGLYFYVARRTSKSTRRRFSWDDEVLGLVCARRNGIGHAGYGISVDKVSRSGPPPNLADGLVARDLDGSNTMGRAHSE